MTEEQVELWRQNIFKCFENDFEISKSVGGETNSNISAIIPQSKVEHTDNGFDNIVKEEIRVTPQLNMGDDASSTVESSQTERSSIKDLPAILNGSRCLTEGRKIPSDSMHC